MRKAYECATIGSMLEIARDEVYSLQGEMEEAADNMPEQLNKAHADAAVELEWVCSHLNDCDPPADLRDEEVTWDEWRGKIFRPQRRDNVVSFLRAYRRRVPENDANQELIAKLDGAIETLNGVFFPGMSGRRAA